ncbi:MAG: STAS domain-containing protein [Tepidimonas sp.]|nr:STAS domain-containing protein [Tepidimonas sp.]
MQVPRGSAEGAPRRWWSGWRRWWPGAADAADDQVRGLREERAALQAALQRRRRHDQVRQAELDELRALLLQQRGETVPPRAEAAPTEPADGASAWPTPAAPRTRTIEQIERIEAQMAQHWPAPSEESQAAATPVPAQRLAIDLVHPPLRANAGVEAWLGHPALTEVAVAFANGRLQAVRQRLTALQSQSEDTALACVAGRLLLDLLWAMGDLAGFEACAAEWAERFGQAPPVWPVQQPRAGVPAPSPRRPWVAPARLQAAALEGWDGPSAPDALDWRPLQAIEASAVVLLAQTLQRWLEEPRVLCMAGVQQLLRVLKAATPSGQPQVGVDPWRLRLEVLRLLDRRGAYELVALDALASVGLPPQPWQPPRARVVDVQELPTATPEPAPPAGGTVLADEHEFPAVSTLAADWAPEPAEPDAARPACVIVDGVLTGDIGAVLARLDAALLQHEPGADEAAPLLVIDAQGLQRLDFAAAGALLQWLLDARARGVRVQWRGVAPLIGLLLHAVGIDEVAQVRLRQ